MSVLSSTLGDRYCFFQNVIHPPILYTGHNTGQIALWIVLALEAVTALGGTDRHFVQTVRLTGLRQSSEDRINPPRYILASRL